MKRVSASARPFLLLVALASLSLVVGVALAFAGKSAQSVIGAQGATGGLFQNPTDVAVRQSSGQIYVADTGNNRIQRLDSNGDFELAFGRDVIETGAGGDLGDVHEVCTSAADCKPGATGGPAIGGQLDAPQKLTINQSTGHVYVLANQRITEFDANGSFVRTWGGGVVQSGGTGDVPTNEEKTISFMTSVDGGTFTLSVEGNVTAPIAWDADAATLEAALVALPNVAPGDISVTRPPDPAHNWTITFAGAFAQTPVEMTGDGIGLCWSFGCGGFSIPVETTMAAGGFEICTVASQCRAGTADGSGAGQIASPASTGPGDIAVGPDGHVFLADTRNARVQEFEGDGDFVRAWGRGVDTDQGWGFNIDANQFEICTAASRCQAGRGVDIALGGFGFVVKVPKNGQFANGDVQNESFTTGQEPRAIAVDAAGIVYATNGDQFPNATNADPHRTRIDRFDSTKSSAGELLLPNPIRSESAPSPNTPGPLPGVATGGSQNGVHSAGLEVDPGSGNLYYLTETDSGAGVGKSGLGIFEIDPDPHPGVRVDTHMAGYGARGLGYADGSDRFYVATASGGHRLVVVDDPPPADPTVSIDPVQVVEGLKGATFSGEVTPGGPTGLATSYRFEYKRQADADWAHLPTTCLSEATCESVMVNVGDGNLPVEVSQNLDERQAVSLLGGTTGGTFTLSFAGQTTSPIAYDASSAAADAALEALSTVGAGNVAVTGAAGGPWTVAFAGALSGADVPQLQANGAGLTPAQTPPVTTVKNGVSLQFGATYEARLRAVREFGAGSATSSIELFKIGDIPPTAETLYPQRRTDVEATLSGRVNPQNLETTYYFEYGTDTGYGQTAPVPPATIPEGQADTPQPVATDLAGLAPETTYHYRLVADNGEEVAPGDTTVEGADVEFTTRAAIDAVEPDRPFEMVTPPFKVVRAAVESGSPVGLNANTGLPSLDGETLHWTSPFFPLTDEVGAPLSGDQRILRRNPSLGWVEETLNTLKLLPNQNPLFVNLHATASSGDLLTTPLLLDKGSVVPPTGGLLPTDGTNPNRLYTRRLGTGVEGYTPWLTNPDEQYTGLPDPGDVNHGMDAYSTPVDDALVNDDGTAVVRWGNYFGLAEDPETPGDDDPTDDLELKSKRTIYLQRAADPDDLPLAPKDLVNECTGSAGEETKVPNRVGSGVLADTIGSQGCEEDELPSLSGAVVGANTSLADDGGRVFFLTPQPGLMKPGGGALIPPGCTTATGPGTLCQPQLYVRQYAADGKTATVRWISRSRAAALGEGRFGGPMITGQRVAELGAEVLFEAASRSGDVVYFQSNSPLVPTDPNGGASIKTAAASDDSWDLYRYELPASHDVDPDEGALTRISGGPGGSADPSTNVTKESSEALHFLSEDGKRAYFVTTSPISGADTTPPTDGDTAPGGAVGNTTQRNLYLFDEGETGSDRYKFVGQLQVTPSLSIKQCVSGEYQSDGPGLGSAYNLRDNCFRGTPDGSHLVISTASQLTGDDNDAAVDVYLYDAEADSLTRLSALPAGATSYACNSGSARCNADLGWEPFSGGFGGSISGPPEKARGFGGMRYLNVAKDDSGEVSVFFESRAELLPADDNGDHWDVYEWREGELFLVSRALPDHHSWFSGNSVDGRDAFIWTSDRIDPRELDDFDYDIYDARIGGGFPFTPPPEPCDVLALDCEKDALPPPPTRSPGSAGFSGPGNPIGKKPPRKCPKGKVRRKGRCVKKPRTVKHHKSTRQVKGGAKGGSK